jgi:hypothetical protein
MMKYRSKTDNLEVASEQRCAGVIAKMGPPRGFRGTRRTIGHFEPLQPRYVQILVEGAWDAASSQWVKMGFSPAFCQQVLTRYPQWMMRNLHRISTLSTAIVENTG